VTGAAGCKLAILISGAGRNLQAFIDHCAGGDMPCEVVLVISNRPDAQGLQRARRAGIAARVVDHRDYPRREDFDGELMRLIDEAAPDLVILAGFMRILTAGFVRRYFGRLLNIHPSLLPKYPGLHTHQRALDAGDREHGATVHFVTEELDGGPPIVQARVPVRPDDDAVTLAARVQQVEFEIYPLAARWFAEGRLQLTARGAELDGEVLGPSGAPWPAAGRR
jgi:phosphoribosylglycinamide formyltransferase-1